MFLVVLFAFVISSCDEDFLNTSPITSISSDNAFDTPERILNQVYGLYSSAKSGNLLGGRFIVTQELRADEFLMNKPNVQTGQLTWTQSVSSSTQEVTSVWSAGFATINRINVFLTGLETNKDKVSDAIYANYVAEAKFLRAYCYFALVQLYARPYAENNGVSPGLPLRLQAENSAANNDLERSTVAEIYNRIISDLNDAETSLPLTYSTTVLNSTRAHRNTAIALKTRVYLVKGEYANVVTEASKIAVGTTTFQAPSGVANRLEAVVTNVFTGSYTGPESILTFPFSTLDVPGGQNGAMAYYFTFTPGNAEYYLNRSATATASDPVFATTSTDARKAFVVQQPATTGFYWMSKFKIASTYNDYIPTIRYAEILLNYAEAAARQGNLPLATNLLNAVRKRSNAAYVFPGSSITTQSALINTILQERKIELLGEGFRTLDLQRLLLPLPGKVAAAASAGSVPVSAVNYVWPVSAAELASNKLAVPN